MLMEGITSVVWGASAAGAAEITSTTTCTTFTIWFLTISVFVYGLYLSAYNYYRGLLFIPKQQQDAQKLVDIVPQSPLQQQQAVEEDDDTSSSIAEEEEEQGVTTGPRRKTRRSRRGGYRRKRQQQKKLAALLANSAAAAISSSSTCLTKKEPACDTSTAATESESCDFSTASSNEDNCHHIVNSNSSDIEEDNDTTKPTWTQNYNNNTTSDNELDDIDDTEVDNDDDGSSSTMNIQEMHVDVPAWQPSLQLQTGYRPRTSSYGSYPHEISSESSISEESYELSSKSPVMAAPAPPAAVVNAHKNLALSPSSKDRSSQYVALDCEMVGVGPDGRFSALARVTLIDWNGNTLMDEYVKPGQKVTDYRTFVSGITPEILRSATLSFSACRKRVLEVLDGKVLVGHALDNDLNVLRINHPWYMIRDTASYEPFMKLRYDGMLWPRGLKDLAKEMLNRDVQVYGRPHCSYEDALAALDLYRLVGQIWEKSMEYNMNTTWVIQQQQQQQQQLQLQSQRLQRKPKQQRKPSKYQKQQKQHTSC